MNLRHALLVALSFAFIIICAGCPETTPEPDNEIEWKIGSIATYIASGGSGYEIDDTITGGVFIFPEGADGSLEVGRITSGPVSPLGGQMFWFDYDGENPVHLSIPTEDEIVFLNGWGSSNGSFDDSINADQRWHSLPAVDSSTGSIVFQLSMPHDLSRMRPSRSNHRGFTHHVISRINTSSTRADTISSSFTQARALIGHVLDSLPPSIQATARSRVLGSYAPNFACDGNYYKGFFYWTSFFPRNYPFIGLNISRATGLTPDVIAHEVGHYMNHVLVGDDVYLILEAQAPSASHGLGDVHSGRTCIVEDYAYFSEYFLTGTVGTNVDPTSDLHVIRRGSPTTNDFPSIEGFGCYLLAALHRTSETIPSLLTSSSLDSIPVVGASFMDIWGIVEKGATNINGLRVFIEEYLTSVGKKDMLPVIAQRLGWRYSGTGTAVTDDGAGNTVPLVGATVVQIAKVGTREYRGTSTDITDSLGRFDLTDLFPGTTTLRFYWGSDSVDQPITVNWNLPTNESVSLGTFTANIDLMALLRTMNALRVVFTGSYRISYETTFYENSLEIQSWTQIDWNYYGHLPIVWSGDTAIVVGNINGYSQYNETRDMRIIMSPSGTAVVRAVAEKVLTPVTPHPSLGIYTMELEFHDLPFTSIGTGNREVLYSITGNVQSFVDRIEYVLERGDTGFYIAEINWRDYDTILVSFAKHNI